MKKILTTFIYTSLAILAIGYLFRLMHWDGADELLLGGFWLHIAAYIGYSFVVRIKDNRMIYPLVALVVLFLLRFFNVEIPYEMSLIGFFALFLSYNGFHLLTPNYLAYGEFKPIKIGSIILLSAFLIAVIFKSNDIPAADIILQISILGIAFLLLVLGWLKGRIA